MCENMCDNGEADTHTHTYTKETNTTGYIVMIYKIKKSILCKCVLVCFPITQLLPSAADKDKEHI